MSCYSDGVDRHNHISRLTKNRATRKLKALFVCRHRQLLPQPHGRRTDGHLKGNTIKRYSATVEAEQVDPLTVGVMAEAGVHISRQRQERPTDARHVPFDYVLTLCSPSHRTCPFSREKLSRDTSGSTTRRF